MNAPLKHTNEAATTFVRRHIGPSPRDVDAMLETVGARSLTALMDETLPASIRQKAPLDLGPALSEPEALAHMTELAGRNQLGLKWRTLPVHAIMFTDIKSPHINYFVSLVQHFGP